MSIVSANLFHYADLYLAPKFPAPQNTPVLIYSIKQTLVMHDFASASAVQIGLFYLSSLVLLLGDVLTPKNMSM